MEAADIRAWLQNQIAEESGVQAHEVSCDQDFESFRLDSLSMVSITFELERHVKLELSPTALTEFNTINKLAEWIEKQK